MASDQAEPGTPKIGKRYHCAECGTVVICMRTSVTAAFACHDRPMEAVELSQLPTSD